MSRVTRNPDLYRPKPDPREIPKPVPKLAKFHGILFHKRKKFRISLKLKFAADMLSINDINCIRKSFYLNDIFLYLNSMSQIPVVGTLERRISFKIKIRKGTLILGTLPDDLVCNRFLLFDPNFQEN